MKHRRRRYVRRRRKSSYLGTVVRGLAFIALVALCVGAVRWIHDEARFFGESAGILRSPDLATLGNLHSGRIQSRNRRTVYPYSVVPGGVRSSDELRAAADDDPLVAAHYSGFDYQHAHIVEVKQPELVYVSYRKDGHIYWTRKQLSLHVGEKLLTDGHKTARTRCGNQVSVLPQSNVAPHEPTMAELDTPDSVASGSEQLFPDQIATGPLEADPGMPLTSSSLGNSFAGGPPPLGFMPMPIGNGGIGAPLCPPSKGGKSNTTKNSKGCNHNPPPPPPSEVPEPGTMTLMFSGAGALFARYRYLRK